MHVGGVQDGGQQHDPRDAAGTLPFAKYQPMAWWVLIILVSAVGVCPSPRGRVRCVLRSFVGLDVRSLALSRILLGAVLTLEATGRLVYAFDFFSDGGLWPRETYLRIDATRSFEFCLLAATGNVYFVQALHVVFVAAALLVLVGYKTRVATLVAHFMLVQSVQRNSRICSGGDMMMRMILLYFHFLPLNVRYSLDALLARSRARGARQGTSGADARAETDRDRLRSSRCESAGGTTEPGCASDLRPGTRGVGRMDCRAAAERRAPS